MSEYEIILFYKYTTIADPKQFCVEQRELCEKLGLKGRMIIATEGVNGTFEGTKEATEKYILHMQSLPEFSDVHWKRSVGTGNAFPKLSIKVRSEIVSTHLSKEEDVNPNEVTGMHLSPEKLHEWLRNGEDITIVDMRNDYEYAVGHFEGSLESGMKNFRDLAQITPKLEHLKEKKVLTVCTGGVRCEKASGYLVKRGFKEVYQLDGGIVSYMEKYKGEDFKGSLYVFDNRVVMDFDRAIGTHVTIGRCERCGGGSERFVNCAHDICHRHFICCETCAPESNAVYCNLKCKIKTYFSNLKRKVVTH